MFGIEKLMVAGGGLINWSFAQAGLLDEVSVVMAPVADGSTGAVSIFEKADFLRSERDGEGKRRRAVAALHSEKIMRTTW